MADAIRKTPDSVVQPDSGATNSQDRTGEIQRPDKMPDDFGTRGAHALDTPAVGEGAAELWGQLQDAPYKFDILQALRRLDAAYPERPRTGCATRPAEEPVRLGQEASLSFAPATIAELQQGRRPPHLIQRFFGLLGPQGPLPLYLTEYARDRLRNHQDRTLVRFLDTFHHRLLTLFYRAWARVRPTVSFDRPQDDRFATYVATTCGLGMDSLRERDALPDLAKLHFAGRFAAQTRSAAGLQAILSGFFALPVHLQQFVGQWVELPTNCRFFLGEASGQLGLNTTIGSHVWDCQQKFRVVMGPLRLADYCRLLPGGESLQRLIATILNYLGQELDWDLQLVLRKEETPPIQLGQAGQLGWTTWLAGDPMATDPDDLVVDPLPWGA